MPKKDNQQPDAVLQNGSPVPHLQITEIAPFWLSAIIESADDAIISKTLQGIITSWNRGAQNLFGYTADETIGKSILLLIPPELHSEETEILSRIRRGERIEHYETRRVRKDGNYVDISLSVSPIKDDTGKIIGVSKIARNVTERKQADARLKEALAIAEEAKAQAEAASRLKDEFLATVSHELRTPLTSTLGWAQMLVDNRLNEATTRKAIETIYRNVKSQAQLVEDLLDISRIANGKMRLDIKPLDPVKVVNAAIEAIKPAAESRDIRLQMIFEANAGIIKGDFERLQQVIWNLLSNAVKFTHLGGLIQVRLERVGSNVEISVSDTGVGINPQFLPFVFERFSQADSSTTRRYGGIGMGLAIVKSIVELHGGSVSVKSEGSGKGAAFTVALPLAEVKQNTEGEKASRESNLSENKRLECPPELNGLNVLVVDDQLETCEMVAIALEQCGSKVITSLSAVEALEQLDRKVPDLLIADLSMPEMDGFELIEKIRKRRREEGGQIPAIAFTAMARIEDRMRALSGGYQMYIAKPININELRAVVAALTGIVVKK